MRQPNDADLETRLQAIEARCRAGEDYIAILNLLNSYGPLADTGCGRDVQSLWAEDGSYCFTLPDGQVVPVPQAELAAMYDHEAHQEFIRNGSSHLTATPKISVDGDKATAIGYSVVLLPKDGGWAVYRCAINHWTLTRTSQGWRIERRLSRLLDGSPESHDILRKVLSS